MAKTKSKRAAARQAAKVREAHATSFEDRVIRHPTPQVRRAVNRRPQRTGLSYFVHELPVLSSAIGLVIVALLGLGGYNYLHNNKLGPFAVKSAALGPCAWASSPATFKAPSTVVRTYTKEPQQCITVATKGAYTATITTAKGNLVIYLDQTLAPHAVNNFVFLATHQYYDGLTFHRVVPNFIVQTGDPRSAQANYDPSVAATKGEDGPGYTFNDFLPTATTVYSLGAVSMANKGSDSSTSGSQFFIDTADDKATLQAKYILFGHVPVDQITGIAQKIAQGDKITSITIAFDPAGVPGVIPAASPTTVPATATPAS